MASSGDLLSRMSLTSIRWPEKANERTSSTTSCRLWISSRKISDTCATDPETSHSATIFGRSRVAAFPGGQETARRPRRRCAAAVFLVSRWPLALALARLAVTFAQPPRHGADQGLHLLDLPAFEAGQRARCAESHCAGFPIPRAIEQQRLRDDIPHVLAQRLQGSRQPFGFGRVGGRQRIEVVAKPGNAEGIENPGREDSALGKIPDVGKGRGICRIRHGGCDRVAVPRQQHLRQLAKLRRGRIGVRPVGSRRPSNGSRRFRRHSPSRSCPLPRAG